MEFDAPRQNSLWRRPCLCSTLLHIRKRADADALAAGVRAFERCGFPEAGFVEVELALADELVDVAVVKCFGRTEVDAESA